jgi:hypothetical protein
MYDGRRHIQVVNLNINGTYVSVYNIELKSDVKGIRSSKERKAQIFDLKELINQNAENSKDDRVREFEYGDDKYVAHNRNLHIVTGMFHINEMRNDEFNPEYIRTVKVLEGLDTHRWIMAFRNRVNPEATNIKFSKDSYTMMISNPILDTADLQGKARAIYQDYKTLVTSSIIMRNSVDMSYFTNYPIDTLFMIYKPKIGYAENGITRPDHFIRQEVYSRLTKIVNKKSKRGHTDDLDFRTMSIKHKGKDEKSSDRGVQIDTRTDRRAGRPPARRVSESSDRSRTRERITRLVSNDKNMRVDDGTSKRKTKQKRSRDSQSSRGKKKTKGKSKNRSKGDGKKPKTSNKHDNKEKSRSQNKIVTKELSKDKRIEKMSSKPVNPSAIDLMIDRYEPPDEGDRDTQDLTDATDHMQSTGDTTGIDHSATNSSDSLAFSPMSSPKGGFTTSPPSELDGVELVELQSRGDIESPRASAPSGDSAPSDGQSKSGQSKSGQSKSGQSKSGQSKSGQSKSGQSKSGQSKSSGSKSKRNKRRRSSSPKSKAVLNDSSSSMRSRESRELNPVIHRGKSLMNDDSIDIDTDSEDDLANDEMLRIMDHE